MNVTDHELPGFITRVKSIFAGEVSAETLEARYKAGSSVYSLFTDSEQKRADLVAHGGSPWTTDNNMRSILLSTWIAFAYQSLHDAFLEADYAADSGTIGFVPPVTAEQAENFGVEVEHWMATARQAQSDPKFVVPHPEPVGLPEWVDVEPCPTAHLVAMVAAGRKILDRAKVAVFDCVQSAKTDHKPEADALNGRIAALESSMAYAESMKEQTHPGSQLHEKIEAVVKETVAGAFLAGQDAAWPASLVVPTGWANPDYALRTGSEWNASSGPLSLARPQIPGPGEVGFDPWCLTEPEMKRIQLSLPRARVSIRQLWRDDPNPRATLALLAEINAAALEGKITHLDEYNKSLTCYSCCPWSPIYRVLAAVTIGGLRVRPGQTFTLDVSSEEMHNGNAFKREILIARFRPADEIDYCDGKED